MSAFDYYDHISRPGSAFAQAPALWLGFTAMSTASLIGIAYGAAQLGGRLAVPALATDTAGVALAVAAHLLITGPFWGRVLWEGNLVFDAVAMPVLVATIASLGFRLLFAAALRLAPRGAA